MGAHDQRRDGSRPSGKYATAINPTTETTHVHPPSQAAQDPPGVGCT